MATMIRDRILSIDGVPVGPIFGGTAPTPQYGINVKGDVLVNQTADGIDLNALWDEFHDLSDVWNQERTSLTDLLVFDTTVSTSAAHLPPGNCAAAHHRDPMRRTLV